LGRTAQRSDEPSGLNHRTASLGRAVRHGLAALVLAGTAISQASADDLPGAFRGNAYATYANVKAGPIATSLARGAFQGCPCEGTNGKTLTNEVDALSAANNALTATSTVATAFTTKTATTAEIQNTATIKGMVALGGLITADAVSSVATISATAKAITPSSDGSAFQNLTIAGQSIPSNVAPNTVVPLPGVGSVTLNKVQTSGTFKRGGTLLVEMIAVDVSVANNLGIPVGSKIVLAHAFAGFNRSQPDTVYDGHAFVAQAIGKSGDDLKNKIGTSANVFIDCNGTGGKTKTDSIAATDNGVVGVSGGETTAFAAPEGDADVAQTTATASDLKLLGGIITVDAIQAVAQSSLKDGIATGSADGSGFSGLTIAGVTIPVTIPPNTNVPLPLLGNVVVNEQTIHSDGSVSVNGLHITITMPNLLGLPVGSELVVAHANAAAAPF
jgi:hypothetical protein